VSDGSEAAFEELVQMHGSMVLSQSLRLLANQQDAEDATQAVFLVLWKKAASLRNSLSVAAWLHRTTRNVCSNAQRSRQIRKVKEQRAVETMQPNPNEHDQWNEIKDVLDDELDRLPEKYRLPLILFHLEGRQLDKIAELTRFNKSTIGTRLRRGREMLRRRIERRGATIETTSLIAVIGIHAGATNVSASFASATAHAARLFAAGEILPATLLTSQATILAKGTLHMLAIAKFKIIATAVMGVLVLGGMSNVIISKVLQSDAPQTGKMLAAKQESPNKNDTSGISIKTIVATLESQREQVHSLSIETKFYSETYVAPGVLRSWKRFGGSGQPDSTYQHEAEFAYMKGKYYWRNISTTRQTPGDNKQLGVRRETSNRENASDGVRVWERRVNFLRDQTDVFVWPVTPKTQWTNTYPAYCGHIGWDCMTELNTADEEVLERHRKHDFLSLLKGGAFSTNPKINMLNGVKCVVLRRNYEADLAEYNPRTSETEIVTSPATETIWLDVDRSFAMRQREQKNERWGLQRTINSEFVEILPGLWFPKKTESQPHAPPDAAAEYQGRPVLSWHQDLVRCSVNDVPDSRFDIVTWKGDRLYDYEDGKPMRVIGDDNQPINSAVENSKPNASIDDD